MKVFLRPESELPTKGSRPFKGADLNRVLPLGTMGSGITSQKVFCLQHLH
jgi:hypothetical protein